MSPLQFTSFQRELGSGPGVSVAAAEAIEKTFREMVDAGWTLVTLRFVDEGRSLLYGFQKEATP